MAKKTPREHYEYANPISMHMRLEDWTQYWLAKQLGVSATRIAQWRNGSSKPKGPILHSLAKLMEMKPEDLERDLASWKASDPTRPTLWEDHNGFRLYLKDHGVSAEQAWREHLDSWVIQNPVRCPLSPPQIIPQFGKKKPRIVQPRACPKFTYSRYRALLSGRVPPTHHTDLGPIFHYLVVVNANEKYLPRDEDGDPDMIAFHSKWIDWFIEPSEKFDERNKK